MDMVDLLGKILNDSGPYTPRKGSKREKLARMLTEGGHTAEEMMSECNMTYNAFNLCLQRFKEKGWKIELVTIYKAEEPDA